MLKWFLRQLFRGGPRPDLARRHYESGDMNWQEKAGCWHLITDWLIRYAYTVKPALPRLTIRLLIRYSYIGFLGSILCALVFVAIDHYFNLPFTYGVPASRSFGIQWSYWAFMTFDILYCIVSYFAFIRLALYSVGAFLATFSRNFFTVFILAIIGGFFGYFYVVNNP